MPSATNAPLRWPLGQPYMSLYRQSFLTTSTLFPLIYRLRIWPSAANVESSSPILSRRFLTISALPVKKWWSQAAERHEPADRCESSDDTVRADEHNRERDQLHWRSPLACLIVYAAALLSDNAFVEIELISRPALQMGCHKSTRYYPNMTIVHGVLRRRVWAITTMCTSSRCNDVASE